MITQRRLLRCLILIAALLLPAPLFAAGFTCTQPTASNAPPPAKSQFAELDEVVITGGKSTTRSKDLGAWLKRLEGQYSYEGYVDLCGNGNAADQRQVTGKADCVSLYERATEHLRSLYCVIDVRWPQVQGENGVPVMGGESLLSPAMVVYGLVPDLPGIQFMQIDNHGIATHAQGKVVDDVLTTREACTLPGICQKVTRITTRPDSQDIAMMIDVEIDSGRVLRHAFLLHRVSNIQMTKIQNAIENMDDLLLVGER